MKLSKETLMRAAEAFNKAKTFDEFKVLLDLCDVELEDFERDYYELATQHPVFASVIPCDKDNAKFDSKAYMDMSPSIMPELTGRSRDRFILPVWIENDGFETVNMTLPGNNIIAETYSTEFASDMCTFGLDPNKELERLLLYELGRE